MQCDGLGTTFEVDPELVVPNPDLSVGEGAIGPAVHRPADGLHGFRHSPGKLSGVVGMDTSREADRRPRAANGIGLREFSLFFRLEDAKRRMDAGLVRARRDGGKVTGEFLAGKMTMTVDHSLLRRRA